MKALIVYAHPNPASFNHAILGVIQEELTAGGVEFDLRDIVAQGFNPILTATDFQSLRAGNVPEDIAAEQEKIRAADLLIYVHPIWWFGLPAILKGYIDRVFSYGFAYRVGAKGLEGMLQGKKAAVFNTTGGGADAYANYGFGEGLKITVDQGIFAFCGIEVALHHFCYGVPTVTAEDRAAMLAEVREKIKGVIG